MKRIREWARTKEKSHLDYANKESNNFNSNVSIPTEHISAAEYASYAVANEPDVSCSCSSTQQMDINSVK